MLIIVSILFVTNYTPGTYLMGWDNLQTDLNPWLGVKRALWSGWQEYQSFGLPAGMAHASDLVRALWVWLLSFVIPTSLIRYIVHFALVGVGAVGAFTLIRSLVKSTQANTVAFVGSLFYLLNFYTIQILALPFEAFTFFFAFLPWELWIFIRFVTGKDKKWKLLLLFVVINIFATPQAYAQQIFAVYLLTLGVTSLAFLVPSKEKSTIFKRSFFALVLILIINSFWILPQIYFLKTSASVVTQSKMNQMATDHVWNQNKAYGNLADFALMNNFFAELKGKDGTILFGAWNMHRSNPMVLLVGIVIALMTMGGVIISFLRKQYIVFGLFVLCMVALLINTFPFDIINILSRRVPILHQIFRSPFTKFAVVYALSAGIAFSFFVDKVLTFLKRSLLRTVFVVLTISLIAVPSIPAWYGNYIAPSMRVSLPTAYTDLFTYFQTQDINARIGLLPEYTYWGWYHHRWGYDGSGFLWYGIEQPIVSRTFDVWSKQSENYFWELQSALISEDDARLSAVLEKYRINYLIYDATVKPIVGMDELIIHDRTQKMLEENTHIQLEKSFQKMIFVYKVLHSTKSNSFVRLLPPLVNMYQNTDATNQDIGYKTSGDYQTDPGNASDIFIPFANLNSQSRVTKNWTITHVGDSFRLESTIPPGFASDQYAVHQTCPTEECAQGNIDATMNGKLIQVTYPAVLAYEADLPNGDLQPCDAQNKRGNVITQDDKSLRIATRNPQSTCIGYAIPTLPHDRAYILEIMSDHISGRNLTFYMNDLTKKQTVLDDMLKEDAEYYVIPPRSNTGIGYSLVFQDSPFHSMAHENILRSVRAYEIPYDTITGLQFKSFTPKSYDTATPGTIHSVTKHSYFAYTVTAVTQGQSTLVLDQAYEEGWIGLQVQSTEYRVPGIKMNLPKLVLLPHVKVNGWANGWSFESTEYRVQSPKDEGQGKAAPTILLIFWPQYLQYTGFGLMGLVLLILSLKTLKNGQKHPSA